MTIQAPPATRRLSIAAVAVGAAAFLLGLVPFLGFALGLTAIALGVLALRRSAPKLLPTLGIIGGILGAIASCFTTALVLSVTQAGETITAPTSTVEPMAETSEQPTAEVSVAATAVPSTTGLDGATAKDTLEAAGYDVDFAAGDDRVVMPSNWTVDSYSPTEAEPGATITLTVSKTPAAPAEATTAGLTATYAQSACTQAIDAEFPYGADQHWVLGKLAEELQTSDDRWYFKITVDVTNAAGATQDDVNVECYVSGSNEAPIVAPLVYY